VHAVTSLMRHQKIYNGTFSALRTRADRFLFLDGYKHDEMCHLVQLIFIKLNIGFQIVNVLRFEEDVISIFLPLRTNFPPYLVLAVVR